MFTDTDSLVYEIEKYHLYEDFYSDKDLFHLSEYSKDSKFYGSANKKVISRMKYEIKEVPTVGHAGLKSKIYSLVTLNNKEINNIEY